MQHLDGLPLNEIADAMQKTSAAVAGLFRRGVSHLRATTADSSII